MYIIELYNPCVTDIFNSLHCIILLDRTEYLNIVSHFLAFMLQEIQEAKQRQRETIMKNIEKRKKTSIALRKRTKKGQPVMKSQIEYILDRIGGTK